MDFVIDLGDLDRARHRASGRALALPSRAGAPGSGASPPRSRSWRSIAARLLLDRLGRRKRLPRRVPRRADRRQHGRPPARHALGARAGHAHRSSATSRRHGDASSSSRSARTCRGRHRRRVGCPRSPSSPSLLFVARPLAVLACLLPDRRGRWTRRSSSSSPGRARPAWCRPRSPGSSWRWASRTPTSWSSTVALAIVVTLTVQATTKRWLARRLDLLEDGEYVGEPPSPGVSKPSASQAPAR